MDNIFRTDSPRPKIKIVNGECVNVLKRIPNESVDLLITDPPFNEAHFDLYGYYTFIT